MPEVRCAGQAGSVQVAARKGFLAASPPSIAFHAHLERRGGSLGRARVGIVAQTVLRSKLPVDTVEHVSELACGVREISRATGRIRDYFQSVLSGSVAAAL